MLFIHMLVMIFLQTQHRAT